MKLIPPLVAAVVLVAGGSAQAQDSGWYVRGDLGASFSGELDADQTMDLDDGWVVGGGGGYAFGNGVRAEGEMLYMQNDVESASEGESKTLAGFANVMYDFNRQGRIQPFVGAGIGFARVELQDGAIDDDDIGFAYQAKAGVAYKINDKLTAEAAYRYMRVTEVEFGSGASSLDGDLDSQAVTIGLRYKLGS